MDPVTTATKIKISNKENNLDFLNKMGEALEKASGITFFQAILMLIDDDINKSPAKQFVNKICLIAKSCQQKNENDKADRLYQVSEYICHKLGISYVGKDITPKRKFDFDIDTVVKYIAGQEEMSGNVKSFLSAIHTQEEDLTESTTTVTIVLFIIVSAVIYYLWSY